MTVKITRMGKRKQPNDPGPEIKVQVFEIPMWRQLLHLQNKKGNRDKPLFHWEKRTAQPSLSELPRKCDQDNPQNIVPPQVLDDNKDIVSSIVRTFPKKGGRVDDSKIMRSRHDRNNISRPVVTKLSMREERRKGILERREKRRSIKVAKKKKRNAKKAEIAVAKLEAHTKKEVRILRKSTMVQRPIANKNMTLSTDSAELDVIIMTNEPVEGETPKKIPKLRHNKKKKKVKRILVGEVDSTEAPELADARNKLEEKFKLDRKLLARINRNPYSNAYFHKCMSKTDAIHARAVCSLMFPFRAFFMTRSSRNSRNNFMKTGISAADFAQLAGALYNGKITHLNAMNALKYCFDDRSMTPMKYIDSNSLWIKGDVTDRDIVWNFVRSNAHDLMVRACKGLQTPRDELNDIVKRNCITIPKAGVDTYIRLLLTQV